MLYRLGDGPGFACTLVVVHTLKYFYFTALPLRLGLADARFISSSRMALRGASPMPSSALTILQGPV